MAKHDPDLSLVFQALADPTRRGMLQRLSRGPAPVTELGRPSGLRLPTIMRHLSVLEEAGLIASEKTGRTRICRAVPAVLTVAEAWLSDRRAEWEARTDRLEAFLETLEDDDEAQP
jgi:DNA-binding transcriptional ArsR family regulator